MRSATLLLFGLVAAAVASCGRKPATAPVGGSDGPAIVLDLSVPPEQDLSIPCHDLRCRQVDCGEGLPTSISGRVFIPSGELPLYNAIVYVPNRPDEIAPFPPGVVCDACGAVASGRPLVVALTDDNGHFRIDHAPAGYDIPLVIQLGRWRRQFRIPFVAPCEDTPIAGTTLRMPGSQAQGDIPQMAISTGIADPFECLLLRIGIDAREFTANTGAGRVHLYRNNGLDLDLPAPPSPQLYSSLANLKKYDVVLLPCEGSDRPKSMEAMQNLVDYTSAGGRVFTTHYGFEWIASAPHPFPLTGDWRTNQAAPDPQPFHAIIDQTFPKGRSFALWLQNVRASTRLGRIDIQDARHDINRAWKPPSQRWIYGDDQLNETPDVMLHMTFNTPIELALPDLAGVSMDGGVPDGGWGPLQCGRVVYSDFHVSTSAVIPNNPVFPHACIPGPLTPQEKALTFMLFDLSACVTPDEVMPEPPIP